MGSLGDSWLKLWLSGCQNIMVCTADDEATASGAANLHSCLAHFFQQEHITWECPGEKKVKKELRRNSPGPDNPPATPDQLAGEHNTNGKREMRHTVSFSGKLYNQHQLNACMIAKETSHCIAIL